MARRTPRGDRRSRRAPTADESWFGAFGSAEDTGYGPEIAGATHRRRGPNSPAEPTPASDPAAARRRLPLPRASGRAHRELRADGLRAHLPHLHRRACRARRGAGAALAVSGLLGDPPADRGGRGQRGLWRAGAQHVAAAALGARSSRKRWRGCQQPAVAGDHRRGPGVLQRAAPAGPGTGLNYVALLVLPVLMAGVLTPRLLALATAGGGGAGPARHGLARRAGGRRRRLADDAGGAGRQRLLRDHACWPASWPGAWRARN